MSSIRSSATPARSASLLSWPASSVAPEERPARRRVTEEELAESTVTLNARGWRIQSVQVFLTYAQAGDLSKDDLEDFFRSLPNIKHWIVGRELHGDGGEFRFFFFIFRVVSALRAQQKGLKRPKFNNPYP